MRLCFTIRDLLWLAALVAVCVAWWADRAQLVANIEGRTRTLTKDAQSLTRQRAELQIMIEKLNLRQQANAEANQSATR